MTQEQHVPDQAVIPVCYRHPDRETYIRCARCERPICPDCMQSASVGFQCPECVRAGSKGVREARTVFGGRVTGDSGYVTRVLIAINVIAFLAQQGSNAFTDRFLLLGLARTGSSGGDLSGVAAGEGYRLLTAAFLHGGLLHLAGNMYLLWLVGPQLEGRLGRLRFTGLYLVSALGGSVASYAFSAPNVGGYGASGAVFGLLGAALVIGRRLGWDTGPLLLLIAFNVVLGFTIANVDWRAHFGGLAVGAALGALFAYGPAVRRGLVQSLAVAAVVLGLLGWATAHTGDLLGVPTATAAACQLSAPVDPGSTFLACAAGSLP